MDYDRLLQDVGTRTGLGVEQARSTADAVMEVLGETLSPPHTRMVAGRLPAPLAEALRRSTFRGEYGLDELYAWVSEREEVSIGFALEHTQVVCQVLAEHLDQQALEVLRRALPGPSAGLFVPREATRG